MAKCIGRKRLEESGIASHVKQVIAGENGACYSSIIMGILLGFPEDRIKADLRKFRQGFGKEASPRQLRACQRVLFGRHYTKQELFKMELFLSSPKQNAIDWYEADKIKVVRFIQVNKLNESLLAETKHVNDLDAGIPGNMASELTPEQREILDQIF